MCSEDLEISYDCTVLYLLSESKGKKRRDDSKEPVNILELLLRTPVIFLPSIESIVVTAV